MMMAGNPNNWFKMGSPSAPSPPSNFLTPYPISSLPPLPSWHDHNQEILSQSWSQLLMSGVVCEEEKGSICEQVDESKKMENWEEQMKQESYVYGHGHGHGNQELHTAVKPWSQIVHAASSSSSINNSSCTATSFSSSSSILDFSNNNSDTRPPSSSDPSSECNNSVGGGGVLKKARVQSSTTQPTFKVRKEKLGDRITALHQLVSPFGKTDTASVLLEAIGYIRFLQNQIQALSLPYLGSGSGNMKHQQSVVHGDKSCIFPEDPGQLLNENRLKRKAASEQECREEEKKELRSRGLCLVPVSCTLQIGNDNGADYWASSFGGGFR